MGKKSKNKSQSGTTQTSIPTAAISHDAAVLSAYQLDDATSNHHFASEQDGKIDHGHGHSHSPAGANDKHSNDHGHSHAMKLDSFPLLQPQRTSPQSSGMRSPHDVQEDVCSHLAMHTTECGHVECLSPDELKALKARRVLTTAAYFCIFFMCCELVGGYVSNSLAIISDAFHLLTDVCSFLISILSLNLSRRAVASHSAFSYGYHRVEVLGALLSILLIYVLTGVLVYEAIDRIRAPQAVDGRTMFMVALLGLVVNVAMGVILMSSGHGHSHGIGGGHSHEDGGCGGVEHHDDEAHDDHGHSHGDVETGEHASLLGDSQAGYAAVDGGDHGHDHGEGDKDHGHVHGAAPGWSIAKMMEMLMGRSDDNINVRAAFIHVLGDALQSIGVMFAAALIWWSPSMSIADPICTFVFSIIVLCTTFRILKEGVTVLMEGLPAGVDSRKLLLDLKAIPGVSAAHDLHVWALAADSRALSVHLLVRADCDSCAVLRAAQDMLRAKHRIGHVTVQLEKDGNELECHGPKRGCVRADAM